jgi:hypothetical protein
LVFKNTYYLSHACWFCFIESSIKRINRKLPKNYEELFFEENGEESSVELKSGID